MTDSERIRIEGLVFAARRKVLTDMVIEWIERDEQAGFRRLLVHVHQLFPSLPPGRTEAVLRMEVLKAITPEHGFTLPVGPRLELLCQLIEAGTSMVDWSRVAESVLFGHNQGE